MAPIEANPVCRHMEARRYEVETYNFAFDYTGAQIGLL
jgi:hypothetical protein